MTNRSIRTFAPATIGNMSCGFDILGLAVDFPGDEVILSMTDDKKIEIKRITGDEGKLPREAERNTAGIVIREFLDHIGSDQGFSIVLNKKMPVGSGLGSSAASAVAAVFAANEILDNPLTREELLPFAVKAEAVVSGNIHADNVAPCLLGGLVLIQKYDTLKVKRIPSPSEMYITLVYPQVEILTKNARKILPEEIPLKTATRQWANVANLVSGFYEGNVEQIGEALEDLVAEPYRSSLIPHFFEAKQIALDNGAAGSGISGSGPTIFSISSDDNTAKAIGDAQYKLYKDNGIDCQKFISKVNNKGAVLLD